MAVVGHRREVSQAREVQGTESDLTQPVSCKTILPLLSTSTDIPSAVEEVPGVWLDEPDAVLPRLPGAALLLPQPHALAGQQAVGRGQQARTEGLRAARLLQAGQLLLPSIQRSQVRPTNENYFNEVWWVFW